MTPDDDDARERASLPRPRGRQAEAAVNDGLILQAARDVLTVEPDAPMAEIAARAGVGVGSLYRRFPSKEALAYRLCLDGMSALADLARETLEVIDDGPWEHFVAFIGDAIDAGAGSLRGLAGTFEADEDLNHVAQQMSGLIQQVVQRAQAAGAVRDDINANDVGRFFEMLRGIRVGDAGRSNTLRRRYIALFTPAFRAPAESPLPGPPPTWQEIAAAWNP
ncbi:MAG: TetR/AcrR family transcriptional regulator [Solirubrobacteraceae bacterium]